MPLLEGEVKPPSWLPAPARRYWRELVGHAQAMRVLTAADLPALALMAQEFSIYVQAQAVLAREGH
ncbi:MAG: hypothetical protein IT299_00745, partial [Dehalococcoidia bacterium]|nr:hypothetical protein [Dehalococcoidia bacterium]